MPMKISDSIINREKGTLPSMTTQQLSLLFCLETSCIVKSFVNVGIVAGLVKKAQRFLPSWSSLFGFGCDYQIFSFPDFLSLRLLNLGWGITSVKTQWLIGKGREIKQPKIRLACGGSCLLLCQ